MVSCTGEREDAHAGLTIDIDRAKSETLEGNKERIGRLGLERELGYGGGS